jgi:proton-translocating NADH-quinone oxidoreductase chain N
LGLGQILLLLLPQLILLVVGIAIFLGDMAAGKEARPAWPPYVALVGLLAALLATALIGALTMGPGMSILGGMMALDAFGVFFSILVLVATALVVLASISYSRQRMAYRGEFYALLTLVAMAMTLAATAHNLLMVFLAMEFISITSYILVGYLRQDAKSNEAAIKYFLYGAVSSAIMLYGMSLLYGISGTVDLGQMASFFASGAMPAGARWVAFPAAILMLAGFGFKIALVPFHQWSPDTYEGAPTPITAFLSAGPKAAGFAILARVFLTALPAFRPDWAALLAGISMVTMTLGNLIALKQTNIKRMLAYSSIAQAGYILIGLASVVPLGEGAFNGLSGLSVYLLAYVFTNLGAFMTVIAFEEATGSNNIADYAGLAKRAPWLAGTMLVFLLSLAGIPATAGFVGKLFVFGAAIRQQFYLLAIVAIINSAVAVFYYLNVVRYMFFTPAPENAASRLRMPAGIRWVLAISLIMTLLIGLYPQPFIQWAAASKALLAAL